MKLYVCYTTRGGPGHPCGKAYDALKAAGHDVEVGHAMGAGFLPDVPFNLTPGRRRVKALTGQSRVPALELDDGTAIAGSEEIVSWASQHPAAPSAAGSP
ncbi:MAG: glutathione S-transferase domain-containing protein [Solirubrobacterales bacterium]|nr:glutathione S-transferase domain-containing protein [Solirubrobacterales bacterium]